MGSVPVVDGRFLSFLLPGYGERGIEGFALVVATETRRHRGRWRRQRAGQASVDGGKSRGTWSRADFECDNGRQRKQRQRRPISEAVARGHVVRFGQSDAQRAWHSREQACQRRAPYQAWNTHLAT